MKLAVNYSPQAAELVAQGAVDIDLWKCPDWPNVISAAQGTGKPLYVHFPLNAGDDHFQDTDLESVERFLRETETPFVNVHLEIKSRGPANIRPLARARFIRNLSSLCKRYGAERVIAENVAYLDPQRGCHPVSTEAALIGEVIHETGCGLLLDTAHALLTCRHMGWKINEYIDALPLELLREVHVTGTAAEQSKHMDSLPMRDEDWNIFEGLVDRIVSGKASEPWAVAFEYGGIGPLFEWRSDSEVLREQLPKIGSLIRFRESGSGVPSSPSHP